MLYKSESGKYSVDTEKSGSKINSGGEGEIHKIIENSSLLAKLYLDPTDKKERKLRYMIKNPPEDPTMREKGHISFAWPKELLKNENGVICGFIMDYIKSITINNYWNADNLSKLHINYKFLVRIALNLTKVIELLHNKNCIIGDLKELNILVSNEAFVSLIDVDSFQIVDKTNNITYPTPVLSTEYTPPEFQNTNQGDKKLDYEYDYFGLAVIIYKLLLWGKHPFLGAFDGDEDIYVDDNIKKGYFLYSKKRNHNMKPIEGYPKMDVLRPELQQLFWRCFDDGHEYPKQRPTTKDWLNILIKTEEKLIKCDKQDNFYCIGNYIDTTCVLPSRTGKMVCSQPKSAKHPINLPKKHFPIQSNEKILIPAGKFQMGSYDGADDEKPIHTVYLDAFYIDKYEVTNVRYKKFMDTTGYKAPVYWNDRSLNDPDHPVVGVTWYDAVAYANWAGQQLPTEAQWEKAARGGLVGKKYPWGDTITHDNVNYSGKGGRDIWEYTSPVGSFAPNDYGLYDMAGNVREWCADYYDSGYYAKSPKSNPTGPSLGSDRVLRGGSCASDNVRNLRVSFRHYDSPWSTYYVVGFRCCVSRSD